MNRKGYSHFIVDLSECVLMDSTFLGVLAGFRADDQSRRAPEHCDIELLNPSARVSELLENLGVAAVCLRSPLERRHSGGCQPVRRRKPANHTREEITRTCLEAHQALMAVNPENVARFKDVAQFLAEDLKSLQNRREELDRSAGLSAR